MLFWIICAIIAVFVAVMLVVPVFRGSKDLPEEAQDVAIYRDQLTEIDRDLARGTLSPDEAERTRTEVARRLLAADATATRSLSEAPPRATAMLAVLTAVIVVAGGLWTYDRLGAPGYPDIPLAQRIADSQTFRDGRMSQAQAEQAVAEARLAADGIAAAVTPEVPADYLAMVDELRQIVPTRPDDLRGWALLALHEARLGQFGAAARAQERVVQLRGAEATNEDRMALVDRLVAATEGFVSPESEAILRDVLDRDGANLGGRYYFGLLYAQTDRPDLAFRLWRDVINEGSSDDPYVQLARVQVEDAAFRAGVEYTLPPERGPDADAMAAARDMSAEDQQAMIEGMVTQLSDRLATEGGTADEWARLIAAYGVLGNTEQAEAIWREAREVFATSAPAMEVLSQAAERAGIAVQ